MAKLSLKVDDLAVESFQTISEPPARGTVAGAENTFDTACCVDSFYDPGCSTHETACPEHSCHVNSQCCPSAEGTCYFSCPQTCTTAPSAACPPTQVC